MSEIERILKKIQRYQYDNPNKVPNKIYIYAAAYMNLLRECSRDIRYMNIENIQTIYGMIIIVVPEDGYLIEE